MLHFCDRPYEFIPSRRLALLAWLSTQCNRYWQLPRSHQIVGVELEGAAELREALRRGDGVMLTPNHPTHSDPQIMIEVLRRVGLSAEIMAAYDVFLRSRLHRWALPRCGAFSIDREGVDGASFRHATAVLTSARHALLVFPEGNVFLQNDVVASFNEGAAFFALKAAKEIAPNKRRVLIVPVSIKTSYVDDVFSKVSERLEQLAKSVDARSSSDDEPLARLRHAAHAALRRNQRLRGLPESEWDEPRRLIRGAAEDLLQRLEHKVGLPPPDDPGLMDRVCRVRRAIHKVRIDDSRKADHQAAMVWADEAMMAFKIASYLGDYVHSKPTLDRFAETVEKLAEDVFSEMPQPLGRRHAYVRLGTAIDLSSFVDSASGKRRDLVQQVTQQCQDAVQAGVDALNARIQQPGSQLIATPQAVP